jgi:hypothetical protein
VIFWGLDGVEVYCRRGVWVADLRGMVDVGFFLLEDGMGIDGEDGGK